MKIKCSINEGTEENDEGIEVECVIATCSKCGNTTESFGTHDASRKRCLALMKQSCPMGENNFYIEE